MITDDEGELYQHLEYFAFGEGWVDEHRNQTNLPFKFTGKELDPETGLYYYGARYYDPRVSMWISTDPALGSYMDGRPNDGIFKPLNMSLYQYAGGSPARFIDPNGLYNQDTGEIEPGDTLSEITEIFNDRYGTEYNPEEIAEMYEHLWTDRGEKVNPDLIRAGDKMPLPVDVTDDFVDRLTRNSMKMRIVSAVSPDKGLYYFNNRVKGGGIWDFKRINSKENGPGPYNKQRSYTYVVGKHIFRYDDLGNIHYGYIGTAASYSPTLLHFGAGYAQTGDLQTSLNIGPPNFGDFDRDANMIDFGIKLYHDLRD